MFGLFNIVDQFAGFILHFIPFYFFLKLMFLVYLFHPDTQGATSIYNWYILPKMKQYEKHIKAVEKGITDAVGAAKDKVSSKIAGDNKTN